MATGSRWVGWVIGVLALTLIVAGATMLVLTWGIPTGDDTPWAQTVVDLGGALAFSTTGAVILSRRPGHLIGWALAGGGVMTAARITLSSYAVYGAIVAPGVVPHPVEMAVIADAIWFPTLAVGLVVLLATFPDGRLSSRWRKSIVSYGVAVGVLGVPVTLWRAGEVYYLQGFDNPWGRGMPDWLLLANDAAWNSMIVVILVAIVGLVVRAQKSSGLERQQMKWLTLVAALLPFVLVVNLVAGQASPWPGVAWSLVVLTLPVAVGVAVLRYRLYDIDRIVSRTVSYVLVSGLLVALFLGIVFVFRSVLPFEGDLAVAASTLAVAASFNPLRRRVQSGVDRRFNRSRYDAIHTVGLFSQRLRDEVDLEELTDELSAVVDTTMQPRHLSVWLRDEGGES